MRVFCTASLRSGSLDQPLVPGVFQTFIKITKLVFNKSIYRITKPLYSKHRQQISSSCLSTSNSILNGRNGIFFSLQIHIHILKHLIRRVTFIYMYFTKTKGLVLQDKKCTKFVVRSGDEGD